MNVKSKLFGFSAASLLALSMAGGAVAQDMGTQNHRGDDEESQVVDASVVLADSVCSFTLGTSSVDFGTLAWDGFSWAAPEDMTIGLSVTNGSDGDDCAVSATSAGLSHQEEMSIMGGRHDHNHDNIGVTIDGNELNKWRGTTVYRGESGTVDLGVGLNSIDSDLDAGTYSGQISFQMGSGR